MKKLFLLLFILVIATGCSSSIIGGAKDWQEPGKEYLKIKADKTRILKSNVIKNYEARKKQAVLGAASSTASSTVDAGFDIIELPETATSVVEYTYISNEIATETPYFADGEDFSRAEYLEQIGRAHV